MHVEKAFVICLYFFLAANGDTRTGNRCIEAWSRSFTVPLECPAGEWIHVVHEVYGNGDAAQCRLTSSQSCSKLLASSQHGLVVNCNGIQSCREAMPVQPIDNCNITDAAAEVKYNCVKDSMNMCSSVTSTVNGSVYLHSPGFPDSVGVNSSCVVRITGQNLQVTLVEERMRSGMLNISGDGRQLWTDVNVNQYNRVLPGQAAEIVIIYDNHDQNGLNLWIRVAGSGQMRISRETPGTSTTPASSQQPSRSQSTSSPRADTPATETTSDVPHASTTSVSMSTHQNTSNGATSETTTISTIASKPSSTIEQTITSETVTVDSTTNTSTALTTSKSATVSSTNMTTTDGEADSGTASSSEPKLIIWIASAVAGCVLTILIVVIAVVLCRKLVKKSHLLETPGRGHFESSLDLSFYTEKHQNTYEQHQTRNQYFVLDPEFGAGNGQSLNAEPGHLNESCGKNEHDQYEKAYDRSTCTVTNSEAHNGVPHLIRVPNDSMADEDSQGICGMTENDLYAGCSDDEGTVEREEKSVQDHSDTSPNNSKQAFKSVCKMVDNDVYDRGPPYSANDNHVVDLYVEGLETREWLTI